MGKSVKLDNDFFWDASGVSIYSTNSSARKTLQEFAEGLVGTARFTVPANGSLTLTLTASTRCFLLIGSVSSASCGAYFCMCNAAGTLAYVRPIVNASGLTASVSDATVTFQNSSNNPAYAIALVNLGNITS